VQLAAEAQLQPEGAAAVAQHHALNAIPAEALPAEMCWHMPEAAIALRLAVVAAALLHQLVELPIAAEAAERGQQQLKGWGGLGWDRLEGMGHQGVATKLQPRNCETTITL
jgi:Zn-dependent membrane protease YugP